MNLPTRHRRVSSIKVVQERIWDLNPLRFSIAKRLLITAIDERSFEQISNLLLQERMLFNESVGAVGLAVLTMAGREEASSAWALAAEFTLPHYQGWGESDWARFLHYCSDVQCQHDVRQVVDGVRQIAVLYLASRGRS